MSTKVRRKKSPYLRAKKKFNALFSEYIRRCEATSEGYTQCVTCECVKHWKEMQAGHFIHSGHGTYESTYDERNVHTQCIQCNLYQQGMGVEYFVFMEKRYGREVIDELRIKRKAPLNWKIQEYSEAIEIYEQKLLALDGLVMEDL